jgi:hypothetical protein
MYDQPRRGLQRISAGLLFFDGMVTWLTFPAPFALQEVEC